MTDVFIEFERLKRSLETLRDELVEHPRERWHVELSDARHSCRRIMKELHDVASLLSLQAEPASTLVPPPPTPPNLKLVK